MDDKRLQEVKQHLQDTDAQNRIRKNIERARSETTVTIGRAAELFRFTENQLRDWEARGLLFPNKSSGGQRLYPLAELDRLAIIRELLDTKKFSPGDIPENIDVIWHSISPVRNGASFPTQEDKAGQLPIDQRVDRSEYEVFWRYFVSQVVRLSLLLICEEVPDAIAGLILPLQPFVGEKIENTTQLPDAGLSLVGWLSLSRAFYSFLDERPSFMYPTDFRILLLDELGQAKPDTFPYHPLVVIQRRAKTPFITPELNETIYRLLQLIYDSVDHWRSCFDVGWRDWVYQVTDFSHIPDSTDPVLDGIMNRVIELGGKYADGSNRWHFSNLYLPLDSSLPVQQQRLLVRAHSKDAPKRASSSVISIAEPGLTFRAYQSGHVIYRPTISPRDYILAYYDAEKETRSAVAIPVGGQNGMAVASLYVASQQENAFSEADLRALRLITRMIEELLPTYSSRQPSTHRLSTMLNDPKIVDRAFREFLSEEDFLDDLEKLLTAILHRDDIVPEKRPDGLRISSDIVSFIEVDIDNQAALAMKYGNQVARNLSKEVGLRIRGYLRLLSNPDYRKLYHVNADRYYMMFEGMSLGEARSFAETLRKHLSGSSGVYRIDARRVEVGRPLPLEYLLELIDVTVRLGVQNYYYSKLKYDMVESSLAYPVAEKRFAIMAGSEESLKRGQAAGGNCIISWDYEAWDHILWQGRRIE